MESIEHDIDRVMLSIAPDALKLFKNTIIYLVSYEVSKFVTIPNGYTLLGTFGWRVYAKIDELQKKHICDSICANGPIVAPSPDATKFITGTICVAMPCFIDALNNAQVKEVLFLGYGFKCPKREVSFVDNLEPRARKSSLMPVYDIGHNFESLTIPLFSVPRPGQVYRMLLGRAGSVSFYATAPKPNTSIRVIYYPRVVHLVKCYVGASYRQDMPCTIKGMKSRLDKVKEQLGLMIANTPPERFSGYRVEVTVTGNVSLEEAYIMAKRVIPKPGDLPQPVTLAAEVTLQEYQSTATSAIEEAQDICRGRGNNQVTTLHRKLLARVYNALGLSTLTLKIALDSEVCTIAGAIARHRVHDDDDVSINPIPIGPPTSESFLNEVLRAEKLLRTTRNPKAQQNWVCGIKIVGGGLTKSFATKMGLAYWAVDTCGNKWPHRLQTTPERTPSPSTHSRTPTPLPSPSPPQLSPVSTNGAVFSPEPSPEPAPVPHSWKKTEMKLVEQVLKIRTAPRNSNLWCAMSKLGGCTKSFETKKKLLWWVVDTYGRKWSEYLLTHTQCVAPTPPRLPSPTSHDKLATHVPLPHSPSPKPNDELATASLSSGMGDGERGSGALIAGSSCTKADVPPPMPHNELAVHVPLPRSPSPKPNYELVTASLSFGTGEDEHGSGTFRADSSCIETDMPPPSPVPHDELAMHMPLPHTPSPKANDKLAMASSSSGTGEGECGTFRAGSSFTKTDVPPPPSPPSRKRSSSEIEEALTVLEIRRHNKRRHLVCAATACTGACTKPFKTRRQVAEWAVATHKDGQWRRELKLHPSPFSNVCTTTEALTSTPPVPPIETAPRPSCTQTPVPKTTVAPIASITHTHSTTTTASLPNFNTQASSTPLPITSVAPALCQPLVSSSTPRISDVRNIRDGDIVTINNTRHRLVSMPADGDCFFHAVSHTLARMPVQGRYLSAQLLRSQAIHYYESAPESELAILEDINLYDGSLRHRARELSSDWGTIIELYALSIITGVAFQYGYIHDRREGLQVTTIYPLFSTSNSTTANSVILFDGVDHYFVAEPIN